MKESDLFEPVKKFLVNIVGCSDVYGEVGSCDVLGITGVINIIVELKTSLNFKVIEQAIDRKHLGHYIYVAVPEIKTVSRLAKEILKQHRIGLLFVVNHQHVEQVIPARFNRTRSSNIRKNIREYHKTQVGGVKSGESKTDYFVSMNNVKEYLALTRHFSRTEGWVTVDQILEHCETHYSNPKPSVMATLQASWNQSWCETKLENRRRYFRFKFPETKEE
ncbi:hypothetical protein JOD82_002205 [Paenibacillus sp. 1182]|uniref:hypothetical protein n=1 Tax=Paenibacillus sp. 1182 TaxID=2806565 RepID=UPI001AE5DE61|nr:hypothetical protein [Paenibacillus sp. 1182]MBP1309185.1 hypothetical protein [Paenibacillus sp. 1182]